MNENNIKILSLQEIEHNLESLSGWKYADDKISKQFVFNSFNDAIKLVTELAPFCNRIDHHPNICISYKKVFFELQRFSVGGKVTNVDFMVAIEIERLYSAMYP